MNRSSNRLNTNWKREWDEEQSLTPEELKQQERERAEEKQIYEDYMMCLLEAERQEADREFEREIFNEAFDQRHKEWEEEEKVYGLTAWEEHYAGIED